MLQDCVTALLLCAMFLALRKARSWRYAAKLHGDKGERTEAKQHGGMAALYCDQCTGQERKMGCQPLSALGATGAVQ